MIHSIRTKLRKLTRDERGNNLVAYAVLLGGIALVLSGGLLDLSDGVTTALTSEADHIAEIAGTSSTTNVSNPASPTNPTPGSPGGSGRRRGRR